jgi:hypothetical protein
VVALSNSTLSPRVSPHAICNVVENDYEDVSNNLHAMSTSEEELSPRYSEKIGCRLACGTSTRIAMHRSDHKFGLIPLFLIPGDVMGFHWCLAILSVSLSR